VPSIDRTEIYAFEEWWKRIEVLISATDTICFCAESRHRHLGDLPGGPGFCHLATKVYRADRLLPNQGR